VPNRCPPDGKNSAGASDICPAASAFSPSSPALALLGKKFKNRDSQITAETGSAFKTPEAFFASATDRVSNELRLQVALKQDASVFCSTAEQKRSRTTRPHAQRSAGRFFGDFLWTSKESHPVAGRHRRT
jgi:hypothetical protein